MAVPVWVPGQVLAAADVNTWFVPLTAVKASDQSVTSSIVLVNDTALVLALAASRSYEIWMELFITPVNNSAVPGLNMALDGPAGCTISYRLESTASILAISGSASLVSGIGSPASGTFAPASLHGLIITSSTAGNLQLQWCQASSSATSTTVKASSFLAARAIA